MDYVDGNSGRLHTEFQTLLHPHVRQLVFDLDTYSTENAIPGVVVTHVVRTAEDQASIYVPFFKRLVERLHAGKQMSPTDAKLALELDGKSDAELRKRALQKFSWHCVRCAVDLRIKHYSVEQLKRVEGFVRARTVNTKYWEFLVHDIAGAHMHIGVRDFNYRAVFSLKQDTK